MAGKNLLVNGKNNITARANAMANIQNTMANRTTASNVNATPNLPTRPTTINLQKAQTPINTKLNNLNNATMPTGTITTNNPAFVNGQLTNQNNQSRFIGFQKPKLSTDLAGNIVNQSGNILNTTQQGKSWAVEKNKPVLNIPTQSSQIAGYNAKQEQLYKDSENLIKKFHYAVKNANGQLTANDIRKQFPEWKDNINAALQLQADITPLVQQGQFADMKQVSEYYNELLKQPNLADANKYSEKQKSQERTLNYYKQRADKLLESNNTLSDSGKKYLQDMSQLADFAQYVRENYRLSGNPTDIDILKFAKKNIPEVQAIFDELNTIKLTGMDKAAISGSSKNPFQNIIAAVQETVSDVNKVYQENVTQPLTQMIESGELAKRLENTGLVNSSTANSLASASKIAPTMVGDLLQGADKLGTAYTRISQGQDRNLNEVTKDIIKGGGGALNIGFNSIMAIPTALFHIANETDLGQEITDDTLGLFQEGITNILDGSFAENLGLSKDTYLSKWYNTLDDETKADLTNEITVGVLHKGGKVLKEGKLELEVLGDAISNAFEKGKGGAMFQAWIEKGLAGEDGKLTKGAKGRIIKEGFNEFKDALKTNFRLYDTVLKNRRGDITANMNTLPDNRTFRQKAESQINQAKETVNEGINTVKEGVNNVVDTAKQGVNNVVEGVQNIKPGEIIKNTAETVGKGVKATSDLIDSGKNAVTKGKNAVTNTISKGVNAVKETVNENIIEPYNKGRGKTNQISTEGINQGLQPQESNLASKTNNEINGANYSQENTKSKTLNKAQLQMLQTNNRMNPKNIDTFKEWYGEDYGQWMYDRGFTKAADGGNLKDMQEYKDNLLASKRATLDKIEGRYQDISLTDMADHLIEKADNVKNRKLLAEVQGLKDTLDSIGLTMKEANRLRELFQQNIKMGFHQDIPADARERAKNEYLAVKDFLDEVGRKNGFDDLDEINREIQKAQHIIKGVESKMNRQSANNEYTLTDYILMAEAFSTPQTAAVFTVKQILKHPKVRNAVLNKLVGGRGNTGNRITPESRKGTNEKVESTAKAKRGEKLKSDLSKGNTKALPNKGGSDNGKHIITGGKTIVTDEQGNSKVKGQISEIDNRPAKPEPKPEQPKPEAPKEEKPKNKVTNKTPKKKVESKPTEQKPVDSKPEEQPKNKVTTKNTQATAPKENQTSEHFSYKEYGDFMKKYEAAEKEINDRLDKQMEDERAEKMERFTELQKKEDKTDAEGKEMVKLASELNNMWNKYDRLKEEEFNKKYPELVAEKKRQQEMFDRDWTAAMDKKRAEIEKPFIELRDKYVKQLRDELGVADDVTMDSKFYDSLTPEQKKIADRLNKEFADAYENLRQKTAGGEQISKPAKAPEKKVEKPKKKLTKKEEKEARARGIAKPDGVLIFTNSEFKYIPSLQQGLIRLTYEEGKAKFKEQFDDALENGLEITVLTDEQTGETIAYNPYRTNDQIREIQEARDEKPYDAVTSEIVNKEDVEDYEIHNGELRIDLDPEKSNGSSTVIIDLQDFLNYSFLKDYVKGEKNKGTSTAKNKITNNANALWDTFEDIDKDTLKILADMGDKTAIKLYEEEGGIQNMLAEEMYNEESAPDLALEEMYKEQLIEENETPQKPSLFEEDLQEETLRLLDENITPQITEEEAPKNKVTAKTPDNKPKDLVTNPNSVETLPSDISPRKEAAKSGPKRIAPDRISWQQLTYEEGAKRIMEDIKKMARHIELQREMKKPMASRTDTRPLSEINSEIVQTGREIGNILGKNWLYKSTRTKEFKDLWKAIANANNDPSALAGIGKEFYEKKVKQDLSKGYIYPDEVIEKIPGAKKAADSRARYQKGLDTSFSSKDERIDYSAKDKIGGGMKRQDGKPLTEEQKNEIVKGVMDFQKTFGINMKKMAEDMGIVYVHVNGKKVFMSKASGMFRRTYNDDGTVKNASVSVGGVETVRWKDKDTGEWMTESANTIMSHELGHVVDYVVDRNFIVGGDLVDIKYSYKRPQNNHSGYADYLRRDTEVVARAFEQYMAVQKGAGENYFDKPGYWSETAFNERVKPILEKNIKNKLGDWYINPDDVKYQKVLANDKNKITSTTKKAESKLKNQIKKDMDQLMKTGLVKGYQFVQSTKDLFNLINGTTTQPRYQAVWHGSPADFERFDSTHMGEGEGAQAHGWGHYVAVNKETGEHYAGLKGGAIEYKGENLRGIKDKTREQDIASNIGNRMDAGYSFEDAKNNLISFYKERAEHYKKMDTDGAHPFYRDYANKREEDLKILESIEEKDIKTGVGRNLYQVEIPDMEKADTPTGSNYIEEGGVLDEMTWNELADKANEWGKENGGDKYFTIDRYWSQRSKDRITNGKLFYDKLTQYLHSQQKASNFLKSLGYDGIHYYGGRDGEAYVIFNDDALEITNHIQYLKDNQGNIAGATLPDGTVIFVEDALRADTAFHETSHRLVSYAKENSPELYNSIVKVAEEAPQALKDYVKETYGDMSPEAFVDEVFAWRQGKYSAAKGAETWYQRMWEAIKRLWNNIKSKFGKEYADLSVFDGWEKMNSEQLMKEVDKLLKGGKEVGKGKGSENYQIKNNAVDSEGKTLTPEQQMYFADSKVRDSEGNLLRVYHGTRNNFTVFDGKDKNWSSGEGKIGNWFTPSEKGAKDWAEQGWGGQGEPKAMGGYLNITNPKIYEKWDSKEHLENVEKDRINYIKDVNEFFDKVGYNPLKETWVKAYFEDLSKDNYSQEKAIADNLGELGILANTYNLDYLKYVDAPRKTFLDKMREKGLSDEEIKEISKEASTWIKKLDKIQTERRRGKFTDAYELFENDLHSFAGQDVSDRVGGGRMAMNDADKAISDYRQSLIDQGYDGIVIKDTEYDGEVFGGFNTQYVAFNSNQFKNIDNENPTTNPDIRYEQAGSIYSNNFKEWFGDWENDPKNASKIVDDDGMPQKMYHGTPNKFNTFDASKIGENTGNYGYSGDGFYFTESKDYAGSYGGNVMEVYLDVKKPFHFTKDNIKKYAKFFDGVEQGHVALDKEWVLNELKRNDKNSYEFAKMWLEDPQKARDNMTYPYNTKYDPNTIVDLLHETERDKTWLPTEFESHYLDEFEGFGKPKYVDDLYRYPSNPEYMLGLGEYSNQDFINAIRKDGYDGIQTLGETVVFEPSQIKSATDNVGTYDRNNPDIRYQKKNVLANGKNKVTNGIRFQLAEGSVDNIDAHGYEQSILRNKSDLQRYADESNIDYTKRNGGYTIDDSLNELLEINSKKRGATKEREIKQAKREQIKEIINTIDEGHGGDWHYQRFFDNRYQWMPTIIFWKGNNLIDEVLAGREISFHQLKNKRGFEHVPTGRLPISPVRLRQAGLLQRLQN